MFYLLPAESQAKELHHIAVLCLFGLLVQASQVFVQLLHGQSSRLPCHEPLGEKMSSQTRDTQPTGFQPRSDFFSKASTKLKSQNYAKDLENCRKSSDSDFFFNNLIFRDAEAIADTTLL